MGLVAFVAVQSMLANPVANAFTRFVYHGADDKLITACSLFYVNGIPKSQSLVKAIASFFSIIPKISILTELRHQISLIYCQRAGAQFGTINVSYILGRSDKSRFY